MMEKNELAMTLEGDKITLEAFVKAIVPFRELLEAVTGEVEPDANIEWLLSDLQLCEGHKVTIRVRGEQKGKDDGQTEDSSGAGAPGR